MKQRATNYLLAGQPRAIGRQTRVGKLRPTLTLVSRPVLVKQRYRRPDKDGPHLPTDVSSSACRDEGTSQ